MTTFSNLDCSSLVVVIVMLLLCLLGNVFDILAEFDRGIFRSVISSYSYIRMASYFPPKTYDGKT